MAQRLTGKIARLPGVRPVDILTRQRRRAAERAQAKRGRAAERLATRQARQRRRRSLT